jgi:hypothetical protein
MTPAVATPPKESPLLFEGLTWREFKAVEQLLDRPGYRGYTHQPGYELGRNYGLLTNDQ